MAFSVYNLNKDYNKTQNVAIFSFNAMVFNNFLCIVLEFNHFNARK